MSHQGTSGHNQVGACAEERCVDKEVFLFPAEVAHHVLHFRVEVARNFGGCFVNGVEGAQKRRLEVERFAGVGYEDGWYAEGFVKDEHGRGDVPRRVAAGLEGVAYAAVGEARRVGFLLYEQFAGKFLDYASLAVVLDEAVVFLGGASC